MFTGLVEERGALVARRPAGTGAVVAVRTSLGPLAVGESVAVDGACLTVTRVTGEGFDADVSRETLTRTTLGALPVGAAVNLERSLPLGGRLGGHFVTGHVDDVCTLTARVQEGMATCMTFEVVPALARFIAAKGSVAVNGASLTVNVARARTFDVMVIPHTATVTSLGGVAVGQAVNIEVDLIARYIARLLEGGGPDPAREGDAAWTDRLRRHGML